MPPVNSEIPAIGKTSIARPRAVPPTVPSLPRGAAALCRSAALATWRISVSCLLGALALGASLLGSSGASFVYETDSELQSDGDFNGDGRRDLLIVDRATGSYRIGYQLSPGVYTWSSARASGIANATGLGIGKLDSMTYDSIALTGPDANRINIIDATNTALTIQPSSVFLPSLGPNSVVAMDIGGAGSTTNDDLCVASLYNGASPYRATLLRNDGTTNRTVLSLSLIHI